MDLFEAFNMERRVKKLDAQSLRSLVTELAVKKTTLTEHTIPGKEADINDMDASGVWAIMTGDDAEAAQKLIDTIGSATSWGSGGLQDAGVTDPAALKAKAEEIWGTETEFKKRVGEIVSALDKGEGYAKPEMPAFEGGDVDAIADALSEPGDLNIDIESDFGGGTASFKDYAEEKNESTSKWFKMAGIPVLNELQKDERFPFVGPAKVMPGAPNLGDEGTIDTDAIGGVAKKFLTKGKDNSGDDLSVTPNQSMAGSAMKPTQTNVKAAKSMLFALVNAGEDMEGAFASSDGDILDGHHRWSGQYLRTGGTTNHTGVHIIDKKGMGTKEFLTMLTVLGTALGRPTKTS